MLLLCLIKSIIVQLLCLVSFVEIHQTQQCTQLSSSIPVKVGKFYLGKKHSQRAWKIFRVNMVTKTTRGQQDIFFNY